jgi:hypothetical protein
MWKGPMVLISRVISESTQVVTVVFKIFVEITLFMFICIQCILSFIVALQYYDF